jgi:DNA processing protein
MVSTSRSFISRDELASVAYGRFNGSALAGIWLSGTLAGLAAPTVAIVGTRTPSETARKRARVLAAALVRSGVTIISGLALGIDTAAHEGALDARGNTIGVLGGGHDKFFPPRNANLGTRIADAGGAVVSPYPPEHPAYPWQFLARNGIIATLADAVVVIEAAVRSGSLNTASWASDRGIPVLAFPGDVDDPKAAGTNGLIRDGAILVRNDVDILRTLGIQPSY